MNDPAERLRSYPVQDEFWRQWLAGFRDIPGDSAWSIDTYVGRQHFVMGKPDAGLLSPQEKVDLRALLKDYAIALLRVQKKSDFRNYVDGAGIVAGVAATWLTPIGLPATLFGAAVFIRNRWEDRGWKRRMRELEKLAQFVQDLL